MHTTTSKAKTRNAATSAVLSLARHLQRAAIAESLSLSLPVLRRILAAGILRGLSLPQLRRQRGIIQRKHLLRMLAVEAGFTGWQAYGDALRSMEPACVPHLDVHGSHAAHLNLWFSSREEARAHAQAHGGHVVAVGHQAVVLAEHPESAEPRADAAADVQP